MRSARFLTIAGLVVLALVLRLGLLAAQTHTYDDAGLAAAQGNVAVNILAGRGIVEDIPAVRAIDARQTAANRLIDPAEVDPATLPPARYQPAVLEPPGEEVLLAGIWKLTGDERYVYLQVLQAILDSLMVVLVYLIAARLFQRSRTALLAAAGYAIFVPTALLARIPHLDIWAVFFTISVVAAWTLSRDRARRWPGLVLVGVLTGLGAQFRPGVLLLAPLLALAELPWASWRRVLAAAAIPLLVAALLLVPWTVRNENVFHRFIPTRIGIGQNLWEGLGEVSNDSGAILNDQITEEQVHSVRPQLEYGTPAYDSYLQHRALVAIREHPGVFAHAIARRLVVTTIGLHTLGGPLKVLEPLLFVLGVLSAVLTRRRFAREHLLLAAVPVATILPYLLLHVEARYILPASFVYLIWTALGLDLLLERRRAERVLPVPG